MNPINRREFVHTLANASVAGGIALTGLANAATVQRKMTMDLVCGNIGISANQREAIELAARHGFESVGADAAFLASLGDGELAELKATMKAQKVVFGAAGLPTDFRKDQALFDSGLKALPRIAAGLQRAGVDRCSTWLTPCDGKLTYLENFRQHASRLRAVADILKAHNLRLGLEYVGPKTSWASRRYPFIHTMAEMKELIAEIGAGNVGFLLDSWHWWHAGETGADVLTLKASEVIAVDLNDAPTNTLKDQMPDGHRELPCATGVIDLAAFLNALNQLGYDGPVRAEPFSQTLNKLGKEAACAAAAEALKKAFDLLV